MVHKEKLIGVALLALLAGEAAIAGDWGYYRPEPQVRLGIDVIWGGYGYAPPPPVVVWSPPRYQPYGYYAPAPRWEKGRGHGRGHNKHRHRGDRWDDCDD